MVLGNDVLSRRNIKCNVSEARNKPGVSEGQKGGLRGWRDLNAK